MADGIAACQQIVAAGNTEAFAMQLALHPADITAIRYILKDEELSKRRETDGLVAHMVNSGAVERSEVSDQAREALQWLKDATARVIHERKQQGDPEIRQGRSDPASGDLDMPELPAAAARRPRPSQHSHHHPRIPAGAEPEARHLQPPGTVRLAPSQSRSPGTQTPS